MQLRVDQRGVCKGTPVDVTGRPHPRLSTKLAIEKRRRRQLAIRWTVSRCALIWRRFIGRCRRTTGPDSPNHTIKSFPYFRDGQHAWVEFRGYLRFSVTARIWRKSWEVRLTDRPLAAQQSCTI